MALAVLKGIEQVSLEQRVEANAAEGAWSERSEKVANFAQFRWQRKNTTQSNTAQYLGYKL